jgi:hypothetical protein
MLCGGSDSAIIPIGIFSPFICLACVDLSCNNSDINLILFGAGLGGFVACRALSQRNTDPSKASRPWDTVILIQTLLFFFYSCTIVR